ncbi:hypothetical protein EJ06DRAFT_560399 [Trichodelitschia bisporula]|uniref:Uncharacterized protein n=1 Tax=Trichodelitschia bisporula TaxID=703511 RepID=A0A6G1HJ69_9PEZI|nr:hypothetical protein EJ06DRAFT_560399 [Trichodelitschia bisporula]
MLRPATDAYLATCRDFFHHCPTETCGALYRVTEYRIYPYCFRGICTACGSSVQTHHCPGGMEMEAVSEPEAVRPWTGPLGDELSFETAEAHKDTEYADPADGLDSD